MSNKSYRSSETPEPLYFQIQDAERQLQDAKSRAATLHLRLMAMSRYSPTAEYDELVSQVADADILVNRIRFKLDALRKEG